MSHGGFREGSGRKSGSNAYGEKTHPIRVPLSMVGYVESLLDACKQKKEPPKPLKWGGSIDDLGPIANLAPIVPMPFYESRVAAGFPSPADDFIENQMDLNSHLVQNPSATFFVRVSGQSMINASIHDNDVLIVDRSIKPKRNDIVIAVVNGELTVKRLIPQAQGAILKAENPEFEDIQVTADMDFSIWGVVTQVIHSFRP
jgi:DNA polymerase V